MAKLSQNELDEIIERDMPGYQVVRQDEAADERVPEVEPDQVAPDISELREKYLGETAGHSAENPGHAHGSEGADNPGDADEADGDGAGTEDGEASEEENSEDAIVAVQPKEPSDPFDHAARPKTVVVSGKDRRVIGSQG